MVQLVHDTIRRSELASLAERQFGDMVKAVVDVARGTMAVGGELHADEEALLLDEGSRQQDLWGINLYPVETGDAWIEFDSMINVRPAAGNPSRSVLDVALQERIRQVVASRVSD